MVGRGPAGEQPRSAASVGQVLAPGMCDSLYSPIWQNIDDLGTLFIDETQQLSSADGRHHCVTSQFGRR